MLLADIVAGVFLAAAFLATLLCLPGTFVALVVGAVCALCGMVKGLGWLQLGGLLAAAVGVEVVDWVALRSARGARRCSARALWGALGGATAGAVVGGCAAIHVAMREAATLSAFVVGMPVAVSVIAAVLAGVPLEAGSERPAIGSLLRRTVGAAARVGLCAGIIVTIGVALGDA